MKFLHDKRRAGVIAVLGTLIGAAALIVGGGAANATSFPCSDDPWGVGTYNDLWVTVGSGPNQVFVGADPNVNENRHYATYVCVGAPHGEASQVALAVGITEPTTSPAGVTAQAFQCYAPLPGDVVDGSGCRWIVEPTGAQVDPAASTNGPGATTPGTGGSVGTGSGTCAYVNSTSPICPGATTLAAVTIHEGDLPSARTTSTTPPPQCTGVNNSCPGAYVIVGGDPGNNTIDTTVAGAPVNRDVPRNCVQVNSVCPPP